MRDQILAAEEAELVDAASGAVQRGPVGDERDASGAYLGLAPSGRRCELRGATFSEFDETGLVVRDANYVDARALLVQLGFA